ncbi:leucine-rich PPR motif-containing protein, mitochondrial isoform X1 [Homalodisca vitripennis]|uniref:leucine-rich PPR motif-containing protein, mitochondrial isoform X1 n=1 Tax=Homalodisca vitripennis TaxID=197043 RepID=UPI001EEC467E|nr:leucine-rich PPR motif-containing protein, mitochondrial isoform X1 [Homalodisca vitripennis]
MSSILRSSKFVRYFVGLARNIVISHRQDADGSLLQRSQHLSGLFSSSFSSTPSFSRGSSLDHTIRRLDEDARRTGRISMKEVEEALNEIRHLKKATTSQSLMVIRCCGNLVPEEAPEHRTKLVDEIWNTLEKLGVPLDISHYNALLKVYLENEHKFSPTDFLTRLERQGVEPNRVTYQRLIAGYCQNGDIAGATKILEYMKEKQLPVSEGVFNALILGHSLADDMESAEGMLTVMSQANLEPSSETYATLLCGYARRGDEAAIDRLITDCKVKDVLLSDRDYLEVVYTAAISGHEELVDKILKNIRNMTGYNQDAANVLLRLVTKGKDEAAYKVFLTMQPPIRTDQTPNMSGHVIIKQLVKTNRPVEQIISMSERLEKDGHTKYGLWLAVETSFHHGNIDLTLDLLRVLKQKGEPIRNHYFWPSMVTAGRSGKRDSVLNIMRLMVNEFDLAVSFETLKDYCLPYLEFQTPQQALKAMVEAGSRLGQAVSALIAHLVSQNRLKEAVDVALLNPRLTLKSAFLSRLLVESLQQGGDVKSAVTLVHVLTSGGTAGAAGEGEREEDDEAVLTDEIPSRFLINVASSGQTRSRIASVLKEMVQQGLGISNSCAELVESRLTGDQLTTEISELLAKLSAGDLSPTELKRTAKLSGLNTLRSQDASYLLHVREKMKANNETQDKILGITRSLFNLYCDQGDLENALKIQQEWVEEYKQELTVGWLAQLLELYCTKEDFEGAKNCVENIKKSKEAFELDASKIMKAVKLYIQTNHFDEAIELLKSVKPREEKGFQLRSLAWQTLQAVADTTKDPEQVKKLLTTLVDQKYIEVNNVYLGPVIKAYILREDLDGAMKEFEHCVKTYRATPWKNEITLRLIEKEDAEKLQTVVDLSTQVHGEVNSLHDLVLSFIECGRIRQARKILETPGMISRHNRIHYACERYKNEGLSAPLEGLVEATKDLPHIDRSEIYYNLLETYCQGNNVDKALGLWTQMQDEDVHVTDEFLIKLGSFLKSKGLQVPFEIPKSGATKKEDKPSDAEVRKQSQNQSLVAAINAKNVEEALVIKENLEKSGKELSGRDVTGLMDLLVTKARYREATSLLTSLPEDKMPTMRTLNFFVSKLAQSGQLDLMNRVGECLSEELKKMTSYINRHMNCAIVAGKVQEELDKLEKQIDTASTPDEVDVVAQTFPSGGIYGVLEASPSYHEQVVRIVDKYHSKGVSLPANVLCMHYLGEGQVQQAQQVYQHYKLANSSRLMFQNVMGKARRSANPVLLEELLSLVQGAACITPVMKGIICSNLLNMYLKSGDVDRALAKLDEVVKTVPLENLYTNVLIQLKEQANAKNLPFNYTIPPKKVKDSSSSSSSSDAEPQKSVAAKH